MPRSNRPLWIAFSLATAVSLSAAETTVPEVVVTAERESATLPPATLVLPVEALKLGVPADGGDLLRNVPGVDGARMGGHGIDPIIRGQARDQLNVIIDGAYGFGGCPNRMDPPSVLVDLGDTGSVVVIKGSQTLRYGGGGSGGTVLFERDIPRFQDDERVRFRLGGGLTSNSDTESLGGQLTVGNPMGFAHVSGHYQSADNYEDGNGNEVRSAYNTEGGGITLGVTPSDHTRLELGFAHTHDYDVLFAGAGMDSPYSDSDQWRLRLRRDEPVGPFQSVLVEGYSIAVDHLMDNFSLRPLAAPMKLRVPTTSDTAGGRIVGELAAGGMDWTLGIDYLQVARDATRFSGARTSQVVATPNSFLWPDVTRSSLGVFFEAERPVGTQGTLTFGLRYDRAEASISAQRAATRPGMGLSPNQLYKRYYGLTGKDRSDDILGGLLRYGHDLGDGLSFTAGVSRTLRTADANERYIAGNSMNPADRSVGNPDLDPERHHQLDIGLSKRGERWETGVDLFYDRVGDFILRDRARGQPGILQSDQATIYRNVDATLTGGEWSGLVRLPNDLSAGASLAYVYGENRTDDRALAQIPPLNGAVDLALDRARWSAGLRLKWANTQTRVDDSVETGSGLDAGETAGWWTLDLFGRVDLWDRGDLLLGVSNAFDRPYAYHVNRANVDPFNFDAVQVNEPGRTLWARVAVAF